MDDNEQEKPEEVDFEARARDRAALRDLIRKPLRPERLEEFARVSRGRAEMVGKAVWGQIHWPKSFGRPNILSRADGFDIKHSFYVFDPVAPDTDAFDIDYWFPSPSPVSKWDLEDTENFYVAFRTILIPGYDNKVEVRFADNVSWIRGEGVIGRGARFILPPERLFNRESDPKKIFFLDFVVAFL